MHAECWDDVLFEIADLTGDKDIHAFRYTMAGKRTPGHLRISEHREMAEELYDYILSLGDIW